MKKMVSALFDAINQFLRDDWSGLSEGFELLWFNVKL